MGQVHHSKPEKNSQFSLKYSQLKAIYFFFVLFSLMDSLFYVAGQPSRLLRTTIMWVTSSALDCFCFVFHHGGGGILKLLMICACVPDFHGLKKKSPASKKNGYFDDLTTIKCSDSLVKLFQTFFFYYYFVRDGFWEAN